MQAATATAASAALPPRCRIRRPASAANGWPHAIHPCGDKTGDRVENDIVLRIIFHCGFVKDHRWIDCGVEYVVSLQDCLSISPPAWIKILQVYIINVVKIVRVMFFQTATRSSGTPAVSYELNFLKCAKQEGRLD